MKVFHIAYGTRAKGCLELVCKEISGPMLCAGLVANKESSEHFDPLSLFEDKHAAALPDDFIPLTLPMPIMAAKGTLPNFTAECMTLVLFIESQIDIAQGIASLRLLYASRF